MRLNATSDWSSFTTTKAELLQVRTGTLEIDVEPVAGSRFGILVPQGMSVSLQAGQTVYVRANGTSNASAARVAL